MEVGTSCLDLARTLDKGKVSSLPASVGTSCLNLARTLDKCKASSLAAGVPPSQSRLLGLWLKYSRF